MIGWRKAIFHRALVIISMFLATLVILFFVAHYRVVPLYAFFPIPAVLSIASGLCAVICALHGITVLWIPLMNPAKDRIRTSDMVKSGIMKIDILGEGENPSIREPVLTARRKGLAVLVMMIVCLAGLSSAEAVRELWHWPLWIGGIGGVLGLVITGLCLVRISVVLQQSGNQSRLLPYRESWDENYARQFLRDSTRAVWSTGAAPEPGSDAKGLSDDRNATAGPVLSRTDRKTALSEKAKGFVEEYLAADRAHRKALWECELEQQKVDEKAALVSFVETNRDEHKGSGMVGSLTRDFLARGKVVLFIVICAALFHLMGGFVGGQNRIPVTEAVAALAVTLVLFLVPGFLRKRAFRRSLKKEMDEPHERLEEARFEVHRTREAMMAIEKRALDEQGIRPAELVGSIPDMNSPRKRTQNILSEGCACCPVCGEPWTPGEERCGGCGAALW
jgi:hypothetical protein